MVANLRLSWTRKYLKKLYTDVATVRRYGEEVAEDGTTQVKEMAEPVGEYPCRISFGQQDQEDRSQADISPELVGVKLFFDIDVDIRKGDIITAAKMGENGEVMQKIEGRASLPARYVNHVEVTLYEVGAA